MAVLTYEQLQSALENVCTPQKNWPPVFTDCYSTYMATGCRTSELLDVERWTDNMDGTITLQPLKSNSPRLISAETLPISFISYINGTVGDYQDLTTRQLTYGMNRLFRFPLIEKGNKQSNIYLFRYYYVKTLFLNGMTVEQVVSHMGWADNAIAIGYRDAILEY